MKKTKHKPKIKKKRDKEHNKMKHAQLITGYAAIIHPGLGRSMVLLDVRNMRAINPTQEQSDILLKREHKWTVVTSVVLDVGGKLIDKPKEHGFTQPFLHRDLVDYLTNEHAKQMRAERSDSLAGYGWIAVPRQVVLSEKQIKALYEAAERIAPKVEESEYCENCGEPPVFDFVNDRYMECECRHDTAGQTN